MPANTVARSTETNVKSAETVARRARAENVRGSEQIHEMTAMMAEKPIVHIPWLEIVLRYFAPTRQWKPRNVQQIVLRSSRK